MCSYIYAPFLQNFSLGVLNPRVLVCGFLLYRALPSLKKISANHRPDYCRDFSRNRDNIMISDDITDSFVFLLKVGCKSNISISVES